MARSQKQHVASMTGAAAAATSSLPPDASAVEAAVATATSAAASARSEIDRLDRLVEMASSSSNNNNASIAAATHSQQATSAHQRAADTVAAGGSSSNSSNNHVPPRPPQSSSVSASPRPLHDQTNPMTHSASVAAAAAAAPGHSVGGTSSSGHSGSGPSPAAAVPTPTSAAAGSSGNTSPFLVPRNPRDTVLTSGSPKRRIAAVHASQQAHQMGGRGHNNITAATSLTGAELRGSGNNAMRRPYATSGASSLGGLGSSSARYNSANAVPPPPPPPPPPPQPASARSTPTNASSHYRTYEYPQPQPQPQTRSHIILPPSMHARSRNPSDPDAEEQAMFESRLCEDEYGVAVRKINHNGKSQLRYVKCVWLPSSEMVLDALGGNSNGDGMNGVGGGGGISPSESYSRGGSPTKKRNSAGNAASTTASMNSVTTGGNGGGNRRGRGRARSNTASGGNSVSSLMGRMVSAGRSRGRSLSRDPSVRVNGRNGGGMSLTGTQVPSSSASSLSRNGTGGGATNGNNRGPPKVVVEGPISSPGMAVHDDERDEDEARLLETRQASLPLGLGGVGDVDPAVMSTKQMRALTWGNKKKVRIPLNRFVCVRKGKTTDRTKRNGHSASRLLSLITDDPANPSLDIEAPTKLDRDKFAKAFARFLEVPLAAEEGSKNSGSGRQRRSAAAATVADGRVGKFAGRLLLLHHAFYFLQYLGHIVIVFSHIPCMASFFCQINPNSFRRLQKPPGQENVEEIHFLCCFGSRPQFSDICAVGFGSSISHRPTQRGYQHHSCSSVVATTDPDSCKWRRGW